MLPLVHHSKNVGRCGYTGGNTPCVEGHWYSIAPIDARGTWNLMDSLSDESLMNVLTMYALVKGQK